MSEYIVSWGDGTSDTYTASGDVTHVYAETGDVAISVALVDEDGTHASAGSLSLTVRNQAPSNLKFSLSNTEILEGGTISVDGTFDAGAPGAHSVLISWGDGSEDTLVTLAEGTSSFSDVEHVYADNGTYAVEIAVTDSGNKSVSDSSAVTVDNVAPQNVNAGADQTANEGDTVNLAGSFGDPGSADIHTQTWSVVASNGQVIAAGSGKTFSFVPNDNGTYTVTFAVKDDDGDVTSDEVVVTVKNVAPTAKPDGYETSQGNPLQIDPADLTKNDSDPAGVNDKLTVIKVNGVAAIPGAVIPTANGTLTVADDGAFTYTPATTFAGTDSFTYTISDGDDGTDIGTVTITVAPAAPGSILILPDSCHADSTALVITGTSASDAIVVSPGSTGATLDVTINGVTTVVAAPSGRIIVTGGLGDDNIQIAGAILNQAWLYGDAGHDRLNAGGGGSVLFGGDGNDELTGGTGRDVMIGGQGADRLIGNSNDDILIAGYTTKDERSSAGHDAFFCKVMHEWNGSQDFLARVAALGWLKNEVRDDTSADEIDFLNGSAGEDWLIFAAGEDKVVGKAEASN